MEVDLKEGETDPVLEDNSDSDNDDVGDFQLSDQDCQDEDQDSNSKSEENLNFLFDNPNNNLNIVKMEQDEESPDIFTIPELVNAILDFLPVSDLETVRGVNKCWREEGAKLLRKKALVRLLNAEKMSSYVSTFAQLSVRSLLPVGEQRNFPHVSFVIHQLDLTDDSGFWQKIGPQMKELEFKQLNFTDGPIRCILERRVPNLEKLVFRSLPRQFLPLPKEGDCVSSTSDDEDSSDEESFESWMNKQDPAQNNLPPDRSLFTTTGPAQGPSQAQRRACWHREFRRRSFKPALDRKVNKSKGETSKPKKPTKKEKTVKNSELQEEMVQVGISLYRRVRQFAELGERAELGEFEDPTFNPFMYIPLDPFSIYVVREENEAKAENGQGLSGGQAGSSSSSSEPQPGPSRLCNVSLRPKYTKDNPFGIHNIPDNDLERILFPSSQHKPGLMKLRFLDIWSLDRIRPFDLESFLSFLFNLAKKIEVILVLKDLESPVLPGQSAHENLLTRSLFNLLTSPSTFLPRLQEFQLPLLSFKDADLLKVVEKNFPLRRVSLNLAGDASGQILFNFLSHFSKSKGLISVSLNFPSSFGNPSRVFGGVNLSRDFKDLVNLHLTNYRGTFAFLHNLTNLKTFEVDGVENGNLETFPFTYEKPAGLILREFRGVRCKMGERALTAITIGFPHLTFLWVEGVKDEGLGIIYREMPHLKTLKLKNGEFTDSGITGVSKEVCQDVMETMTYNITDPDKFRTDLFIGSLSHLKVLELECNGMKDLSIIFGLTSCLTLHSITLTSSEITDAGMRFLAFKLGGNRSSLRHLDVSGCGAVSAEGHFYLKDKLKGRSIFFSPPTPVPPRCFPIDSVRSHENLLRGKFRNYMEKLRMSMNIPPKLQRNYAFLAFLAEHKIGYALNPEGSRVVHFPVLGGEGENVIREIQDPLYRYNQQRLVEMRENQEHRRDRQDRLRFFDMFVHDPVDAPIQNLHRAMRLSQITREIGEIPEPPPVLPPISPSINRNLEAQRHQFRLEMALNRRAYAERQSQAEQEEEFILPLPIPMVIEPLDHPDDPNDPGDQPVHVDEAEEHAREIFYEMLEEERVNMDFEEMQDEESDQTTEEEEEQEEWEGYEKEDFEKEEQQQIPNPIQIANVQSLAMGFSFKGVSEGKGKEKGLTQAELDQIRELYSSSEEEEEENFSLELSPVHISDYEEEEEDNQ